MQVLFCHDGPLKVDVEGNFYGIAHSNEMFKRYCTLANRVSTVIRLRTFREGEKKNNYSKITLPSFKVYEIPNLNTAKGILFKKNKAREIIENAITDSDYVVARLPSISGFIAIDYAKKYNKPYITEVVACPWDAHWNHSFKGKLVALPMYLATKKRVKESKYVVYVTNKFLQKRYPTRGNSVNCSNVALPMIDENVLNNRIKKINNKDKSDKI